jgi:hypothetical protein
MIKCYFNDGNTFTHDSSTTKTYIDLKKQLFNKKLNLNLNNLDDIKLISYGKSINDLDIYEFDNNQVVLVHININIELNKILTDKRLIDLLSDADKRKIFYDILDDPTLLEKLKVYTYQKEYDQIRNMQFNIADEQIKRLLDNNKGNIEIVVSSILNL